VFLKVGRSVVCMGNVTRWANAIAQLLLHIGNIKGGEGEKRGCLLMYDD